MRILKFSSFWKKYKKLMYNYDSLKGDAFCYNYYLVKNNYKSRIFLNRVQHTKYVREIQD